MQFPDRETVARIRAKYPAGTRVELIEMADVQSPPVGTIGKIVAVDDAGDLCVVWSTGSTLKIVLSEDRIRIIQKPDDGGLDDGGCLKKFRDD